VLRATHPLAFVTIDPRLAFFMERINVVYDHKPTLFGTKI
jgi:hypothetical protein